MDFDSKTASLEVAGTPEDIHNTFRIIYSCIHLRFSCINPLDSPKFDIDVLVSSLRVATTYDYPKLRQFAIQKLEEEGLPCFEHLSLAREYTVPGWETMIMDQLVARPNPITLAEAQVLGLDLFVLLVTQRETKMLSPPKSDFEDVVSSAVGPSEQKDSKKRWNPFSVPSYYPAPRVKASPAMRPKTKPSEPKCAPNPDGSSGGGRARPFLFP